MAPLLAHSLPTFERYAAAHGYDVHVEPIDDHVGIADPSARRAARWQKIDLLWASLSRHRLVLWMDADAMFLRFDRDIADDLPPTCFQGLVLESLPTRTNPNTGVWLLRSGRSASAFLDEVLERGLQEHSWADQATVCAALGWNLGDHHGHGARWSRSTQHDAGTAWLPVQWNPVGRPVADARVLHCAGAPIEDRVGLMVAAGRRHRRSR